MSDPTSNINNIDPSFPVPGKNNNTQGFRSNFSNIQQALTKLNNNVNNIAACTVNINSPQITATQSLTTLGPLYFSTQTFAYITTVGNVLSLVGKDSNGKLAAGAIAFSSSIVTIAVNINSVDTDASGTYFITPSSTQGLLVGGVFSCPSTGTGPFTITKIDGNKIYFSGSGGLDPSVDVTMPTFNKNTVLTTSTVLPFFGGGFPGKIVINSVTSSTSPSSGALVVNGGAGIAGNVYVGGDVNINGQLKYTAAASSLYSNLVNTTITATTTTYQVFPGGIVMFWGHVANSPSRGTKLITYPTVAGNTSSGFANGTLNISITPTAINPNVTHCEPIYGCAFDLGTITGKQTVVTNITGSYGAIAPTKTGFTVNYYQNIVTYNCVIGNGAPGNAYVNRVFSLNTVSYYWSAVGF
jgi:hypothetical protein